MTNRTENDSYKIFRTLNLLSRLNTYIATGIINRIAIKSVLRVSTLIYKYCTLTAIVPHCIKKIAIYIILTYKKFVVEVFNAI